MLNGHLTNYTYHLNCFKEFVFLFVPIPNLHLIDPFQFLRFEVYLSNHLFLQLTFLFLHLS